MNQTSSAWLTTGWGAVGVRWCSRCTKRFDGPAFVYDDYFGDRQYFCRSCFRAMRDLALRTLDRLAPPDVHTRRLAMAKVEPCEVCERPFAWIGGQADFGEERPRPRTHLCSERCRRQRRNGARQVRHEERPCAGCPRGFVPMRENQRYHSPACRQRAYRSRKAQQARGS